MKLRQAESDLNESLNSSFFYEKAFETPERTTQHRFFSKNTTDETRTTLGSPRSLPRKNRTRLSESVELTLNATVANHSRTKLAFDFSLIDNIEDYERNLIEETDRAENIEKIKKEFQTWTDFYADLDLVANSQERAVAARRVAGSSQKLLTRLISLHDQHIKRCTKYTDTMKETILGLKREILLALKLKEAMVVKSMDKERMEKEIEDMFENGDDFNYKNFTSSARKLLDRGESQLTYFLIEAYKELCKDRQLPSVENPDINVNSMARWETEMKMKFMLLQRRTANAVINYYESQTIREDAQAQTEAEYISPNTFELMKAHMRELEAKLKMQEKYLKEIAEDVSLKSRSLEFVVAERNTERESNTDLRVRAQNLAIDLNVTSKKLEDANRKLIEFQNKVLTQQSEKNRHVDTIRVHEENIARLLKEIANLKLELEVKDKEKMVVEEQLAKAIRRFTIVTTKPKPVDIVNKHRPRSSTRRSIDTTVKKDNKLELKRNRSLVEVRSFGEIDVFIEEFWKGKRAADVDNTPSVKKRRPRRLSLVKKKAQEDNSEESQDETVHKTNERRRHRDHDFAESSPSSSQFSEDTTPYRAERASFVQEKPGKPRPSQDLTVTQTQRRLSKQEPEIPNSLRRNSTVKATAIHKGESLNPQRRNTTASPAVRRPSTTQINPMKREDRRHTLAEESPWAPRIRSVQEDEAEENEGVYNARSIESVTTNSSQDERVAVSRTGQIVTLFSKKLDTLELQMELSEENSKSIQYNSEDPDMVYDEDGTARTRDGESRFYLPFNPNTVFGLRGDVFYHTLFQVFGASSKTADGTAFYVPPYKLEGSESPTLPTRVLPIKRSPKKPPHTAACGGNCKHLNRGTKPKVREDMVLVLKKQDIGI